MKKIFASLLIGAALISASPSIAQGMGHSFFMRGHVVAMEDTGPVICIGKADGAQTGQVLDVYRVEYRHAHRPEQTSYKRVKVRLRGGILSRSLIEFGQCQKSGIAAELLAQLTLAACDLFHHFAHGARAAHAGLSRNARLGHWPLRARRRGCAIGMVRGVIADRLRGCRRAYDSCSSNEE